ncbi:hypothetical protein EVAR_25014_1 [Eumeta japonica]|uniref:Uncharacterized protein n=1 Tax=Eumeta variegata TaxID=151549 RepID=A0A4C1V7X9_EUMVA|nr:hypothetical protein EVAR_25014_1 [Eumeta japonica]
MLRLRSATPLPAALSAATAGVSVTRAFSSLDARCSRTQKQVLNNISTRIMNDRALNGDRLSYPDQHDRNEMRQDSDVSALAERIDAFKSDPEKLRQATEFVDQLIQQARKQAELKHKEKEKTKFDNQDADVDGIRFDPDHVRIDRRVINSRQMKLGVRCPGEGLVKLLAPDLVVISRCCGDGDRLGILDTRWPGAMGLRSKLTNFI